MDKTAAVKRDMNKVGQIPELIFRVLIMLNFLIIMFVTALIGNALWGYVHEGSALEFLIRAGHVPRESWIYLVTGLMLYASLILLLTVECNNHPELVCKLILEFGIAIGISYATGFGYVGMIVLLLADIMRYTIDWQKRAMYIVAVSVFFLLMNGNILPVRFLEGEIEGRGMIRVYDPSGAFKALYKWDEKLRAFRSEKMFL